MDRKYNWYALQPVDAWFFRDDRPYNGNEYQSGASIIFPPFPSTVVGALRASLARKNGWNGSGDWPREVKNILGDGFENLGDLSFSGPFLFKNGDIYYPVPGHILGEVNQNLFLPHSWMRPSEQMLHCDMGENVCLPYIPKQVAKKLVPATDFFISASGMTLLLSGVLPQSSFFLHRSDFYSKEQRIGIARDAETGSTKQGALYNPSFIRLLQGVSLCMGICGLPEGWNPPGIFPMGGESRLTRCTLIPDPLFAKGSFSSEMVLAVVSPINYKTQKWWGADPGESAKNLSKVFNGQVKTLLLDRPLKIGGWDSRKNSPIDSKPFIKPGTVWWLENETFSGLQVRVGEKTTYGYGQILTGCWPKTEKE